MSYPEIIALDPGTINTAIVIYNHKAGLPVWYFQEMPNDDVLKFLEIQRRTRYQNSGAGWVACEQFKSYGGPVGEESIQTIRWSGRFEQQAIGLGYGFAYLPRQMTVSKHLCHTNMSKDKHIRAVLMRRFSPSQLVAVSNQKRISCHGWSALAVAVTFADLKFET